MVYPVSLVLRLNFLLFAVISSSIGVIRSLQSSCLPFYFLVVGILIIYDEKNILFWFLLYKKTRKAIFPIFILFHGYLFCSFLTSILLFL